MHNAGLRVARVLFPTLRWREAGDFGHEEARIVEALRLGVGGFLLFGGTVDSVAALTSRLRNEAGRPLLIASDLERGAGQQVRGLAELPPPAALAAIGEQAVIRGAGLLTGTEALRVGINWVLAPVADLDLEPDNPIVQTRSFGSDPLAVSESVASWIAGCQATGALACAKHFPGHGRTRVDSHDALPVVSAGRDELSHTDLVPFRAAIEARVDSVMTSHIAFPALDPSGAPATFSPVILGLLRESLGFHGIIASDALTMAGASTGRSPGSLALEAVRAGVDVLLDAPEIDSMAAALEAEAGVDPELQSRLDESIRRVEHAAGLAPANAGDFIPTSSSAVALGDWLLSLPAAREPVGPLRTPLELVVVDDDLGGKYPPSSPSNLVEQQLRGAGISLGPGGSRVVLAFAEPRASKGRAGFSDASLATLRAAAPHSAAIVLFGHPRLIAQMPHGPPVLLAWHRQGLMQAAAARWLRERVE
ncbi:MAG TPA: glycoside hydrolase family 3 N-terminal domain-containing protein [Gemmatimonadales bacterium]